MFSLTGWTAAGFSFEGESAHSPEPEPVSVHLEEGVYTADLEQSEINWADRNPHSTHHGAINLSTICPILTPEVS